MAPYCVIWDLIVSSTVQFCENGSNNVNVDTGCTCLLRKLTPTGLEHLKLWTSLECLLHMLHNNWQSGFFFRRDAIIYPCVQYSIAVWFIRYVPNVHICSFSLMVHLWTKPSINHYCNLRWINSQLSLIVRFLFIFIVLPCWYH